MRARDIMIPDVVYVTPEAQIANVARLLPEAPAGAVPVVDARGAPVGIVTRSDIARALKRTRANWIVKKLRGEPAAVAAAMTAPVLAVEQALEVELAAQLMQTRGLKRLPVVDGGEIVGILWRPDVLRALERPAATPDARAAPPDITAEHFRQLIERHENEESRQHAEALRLRAAAEQRRIDELAAKRLNENDWRDLLERARAAAAAGEKEFMLTRFPSRLCSDGGRAINAPDPNWPATLRGEPRDIFERWRRELEPRGFQLAAQIVEFPGGVPGDAALFLIWAA